MKLILLLLTVLLSYVTTRQMMRLAIEKQIIDVPNDRSSHTVPTPTGGGIAVVMWTVVSWSICLATGWVSYSTLVPLLLASLLIAGIGYVDDRRDLPASWRLAIHLLAAVVIVGYFGGIETIEFGDFIVNLGIIGGMFSVLLIVWLLNLYNFMDGIDGLAGAQALTCVLTVAICGWVSGDGEIVLLSEFLAASVVGFLILNWPPAKIFMGDVGSAFLGFVFGAMAVISHDSGELTIWVWLIALGVFVVDSTLTLLVRIARREKWMSPHRSHGYQKASRRLQSHRSVTLSVILVNLMWLMPLAAWASLEPEYGSLITMLAWSPLVIAALILKVGRPD